MTWYLLLGFLCTKDAASVGNYGVWDQVRAFEWVRDVISDFNGDPNDVTIFGQSAGGSSESQLIMSVPARDEDWMREGKGEGGAQRGNGEGGR